MIIWFKNFWRGVKNIFQWIPVIYNDRHWDYVFIFIILKHKLDLMLQYRKHDSAMMHYVKEEEDNEKIKKVIEALDRLIKDEYWESKDYDKEVIEKQKDLDIVFNTLNNDILGWWD